MNKAKLTSYLIGRLRENNKQICDSGSHIRTSTLRGEYYVLSEILCKVQQGDFDD